MTVEGYLVLGGLLLATMVNIAVWYRLGRLEQMVSRACPFGACPLYQRAASEAAPARDNIMQQ